MRRLAIAALLLWPAAAAADPLFTRAAARRAAVRATAFLDVATTWSGSATITGAGAGVRLQDGRFELALALRDLRAPGESAALVALRAGLDWPLDAAHALSLPVRVELGAGPDQAELLSGSIGLAVRASGLALGASAGLLRTSLRSLRGDAPVPFAAITLWYSGGAP